MPRSRHRFRSSPEAAPANATAATSRLADTAGMLAVTKQLAELPTDVYDTIMKSGSSFGSYFTTMRREKLQETLNMRSVLRIT